MISFDWLDIACLACAIVTIALGLRSVVHRPLAARSGFPVLQAERERATLVYGETDALVCPSETEE